MQMCAEYEPVRSMNLLDFGQTYYDHMHQGRDKGWSEAWIWVKVKFRVLVRLRLGSETGPS